MYIENERENLVALSTAHNATNFLHVRRLMILGQQLEPSIKF